MKGGIDIYIMLPSIFSFVLVRCQSTYIGWIKLLLTYPVKKPKRLRSILPISLKTNRTIHAANLKSSITTTNTGNKYSINSNSNMAQTLVEQFALVYKDTKYQRIIQIFRHVMFR